MTAIDGEGMHSITLKEQPSDPRQLQRRS